MKNAIILDEATGKLVVSGAAAGIRDRGFSPRITVMTRNVYLGAPIGPVLGAGSLAEVPGLVSQMWATVQANDFPARAQVLADEIATAQPELVGLQEVSMYRIQFPGDYMVGNPMPAETVVLDYLELLLGELESRGLNYVPVAVATGTDIELPSAVGEDLRMTDRDVILARSDVAVDNAQTGNYSINLTVPVGGAGGPPVTMLRSWASVDATVFGQTIRFLNTHLETTSGEPIQVAQASELLGMVATSDLPVLLAGDFNSAADGSSTQTYGLMVSGGMGDTWNQANPHEDGNTCCHDDDLLNPTADMNRRIDLIFALDRGNALLGAQTAQVVGIDPSARTPSGLWPSDHAGVVVELRIRPAPNAYQSMPHGGLVVSGVK